MHSLFWKKAQNAQNEHILNSTTAFTFCVWSLEFAFYAQQVNDLKGNQHETSQKGASWISKQFVLCRCNYPPINHLLELWHSLVRIIYLVWNFCLFQTWKNNLFHTYNWKNHLAWTRKKSSQDSIILKKYWMHHVNEITYFSHGTIMCNNSCCLLLFFMVKQLCVAEVMLWFITLFIFFLQYVSTQWNNHLRTNQKAYHRVEWVINGVILFIWRSCTIGSPPLMRFFETLTRPCKQKTVLLEEWFSTKSPKWDS